MRIAYYNKIDPDSVTLSASTILTGYPETNLQEQRLTKQWHSSATTGQSIIIDLSSAQTVTIVALVDHNFASTTTVTLTGSDNLLTTSPMAWNDWHQVGSGLSIANTVSPAITNMTASTIAFIDSYNTELRTYAWSGSVWSVVGSALSIVNSNEPALATLTASTVAHIDDTNDLLRTYAWSGSVWSVVGSALSITGVTTPALAALTASTVSFIDAGGDQLRTYAWSGSVWSVVGSALSITGVNTPALAALTASTVSFIDAGGDQLRTYAWSGSVWSVVGSTLSITTDYAALARLTASQVALVNSADAKLKTYAWGGSTWSFIGSALTVAGFSNPAMTYLTTSTIAYIDQTNIQLKTYQTNTTLTISENIVYNSEMMLKYITSASKRYWRLNIENQGTIELGRLWLGEYITIDPSSLDDFRVIKKRSDTVMFGKNRQKYSTPGNTWRRFELSFPPTGGSTLSAIQTMYDTVGNHSSIIFCNFDDLLSYTLVMPCYVNIDGEMQFTHSRRQKYNYDLLLEENK